MDIKSIFSTYLLMPILVVISTAIMAVVNKKNVFLSNKKLIIGILLGGILLAIPGFLGFLNLSFMPWGFLSCQLIYLLLGVGYVYYLVTYHERAVHGAKGFVFAASIIGCFLGIYLFSLAFNWVNALGYGWQAGLSIFTFVIPLLFWWAYIALLNIPIDIYKIWQYPVQPLQIDIDHLDFNKLLVLELDLYKKTTDQDPLKVKVKAPRNMNFGVWFHKFIDDYNLKFPNAPVVYRNEEVSSYKWIFYIKTSFFNKRQFIDPDLTIEENAIEEKHTIYAKRVSEAVDFIERKGDEAVYL
jgi:hypothetical protein